MFDKEFLRKLEYLDVVARKILSGRIRADRMSARRGASARAIKARAMAAPCGHRCQMHIWHGFSPPTYWLNNAAPRTAAGPRMAAKRKARVMVMPDISPR